MKPSPLVIRVAALMLIIFASGVWVGRSLVPRPGSPKIEPDPEAAAQLPARPRRVFARYVQELELTPAQQQIAAPLLLECASEMRGLAKDTPERLAALERFHKRLSPYLDSGQRARATAIEHAAREGGGDREASATQILPKTAESNPPDPETVSTQEGED